MNLIQNIGDYRIIEKLGRGGMADVYLAIDAKTDRRIALKLVEKGEGREAQEIIEAERLGAELQKNISLVDPRVPQIYGYGDLESYFFIEMEFVEGTDLSTQIGSGLMPEEAARIASSLCSILCNTHAMSLEIGGREMRAIVHGDIKPKNIRIEGNGNVRVLDFGIAKGLSITHRLTSNVFGSVAYSSPERLETGTIDEKSDLWAVGVVLYEMVEGRHPFESPSTEKLELIIRSRNPMRPMSSSCPLALQEIIYKALAQSPERRYSDATQFESDLQSFLTGTGTIASQENEHTRRTIMPAGAGETTRTSVSLQIEPKTNKKVWWKVVTPARLKELWTRYNKWIQLGGLSLLLIGIVWEGMVGRSAAQLKSDLLTARLDGDDAWVAYAKIKKRSPFGIAPLLAKTPLKSLLRQKCQLIFDEYRNSDAARIREGDWIRCKRFLTHATQLDPGDKELAAMFNYANGHVLRIHRENYDAVSAFQLAASLDPKWPDPYLGMARTYIYNLGDTERGMQALDRAQQLGHTFGRRELGMMAEAHRSKGFKMLDNAHSAKGTDQEKEFLERTKDELKNALKIYIQIAPWGNSAAQISIVQARLDEAERRLDEINKPNPILPWNWFK